jgi:cytochrome P450
MSRARWLHSWRLADPYKTFDRSGPIGSQRVRYLEGRLQVARKTGGEGLIAELVRVEKEGGHISAEEMVAMVFLLLGAGSETTTHLISGSVYELGAAPNLWPCFETHTQSSLRRLRKLVCAAALRMRGNRRARLALRCSSA